LYPSSGSLDVPSVPIYPEDCQPLDLLTALDSAYLIFKVFRRIGQIVLVIILSRLIECLRDLVAHTWIDKSMEALKRIPNRGARKPKAPNRELAE
jgi:hypothetical protein